MLKRTGRLFYLREESRYAIMFDDDGSTSYGIHCGQTLDAFIGEEWQPTRMEYAADWYLVGFENEPLQGLAVRAENC